MKNICIIGLGNMGKAIFEVLKKEKGLNVFGCEREDDLNKKLAGAEAFIIAVKPQSFEEMAKSIKIDLSKKLAISIMAGMSIKKIQSLLRVKKVVRTMPNLSLKVGLSVTGWVKSKEVSKPEELFVKKIISLFGTEIEVKKESKLNDLTAINGCGPAYYFLITSLLQSKAEKFGFSPEEAKRMAEGTFIGAAGVFKHEKISGNEMIKRVASKKGSTEAALKYFKKKKLPQIFLGGVEKARKRAEELNS